MLVFQQIPVVSRTVLHRGSRPSRTKNESLHQSWPHTLLVGEGTTNFSAFPGQGLSSIPFNPFAMPRERTVPIPKVRTLQTTCDIGNSGKKNVGGITLALAFQVIPIPQRGHMSQNGGNALGIENSMHPILLINLSVM